MKILRIILAIIVILIVIVLVAAIFIRKDYRFQRSIVINKPNDQVFSYLRQLKNQDQYSKWVMMDPAMKKDFRGTDGHPGFVYAWDSQNKDAGKGEQEITRIDDGREIEVEVRFEKPFKSTMQTIFTTQQAGTSQTNVVWGISGHSNYPLNVMNLFIPGMLSKDLDTSLTNLKRVLEQQ